MQLIVKKNFLNIFAVLDISINFFKLKKINKI